MPQDQVEEIKQKSDIVSVIGEYIDLKKAGRNYKSTCPFHSEKLPSFVVSPELQIYKCFGCGVSGDVFTFLQEYEGMDFYEALKVMADKTGVKLKQVTGGKRSQKQKYFEINTLTQRFYRYVLTRHKKGEIALKYLKKDRKMKNSIIEEFGLGYSPNEPFALKGFLIDKKRIALDELIDAGIVVKTRRGVMDRFRGRVIFPLHDHRGNIVGFAGRIMPGAKKEIAKYINSPETPVYHKSDVLFGLDHARKFIKKKGWAIIVEGELDMISSWQEGIKNTVAIKGSAITDEQAKLLSRYAEKVILALDSDIAGNAAAMRGIKVLQKEGFEIKVAKLDEYKDPDDYLHNNPEGYKEKLKNAKNVWDYLIESIFEKHNEASGSGKAKISSEVVPILASISDSIVQAHYVSFVAERLNVKEGVVVEQVEKTKPNVEISSQDEGSVETNDKSRKQLLEERLLSLCFKNEPSLLTNNEIKSLISSNLAKKILDEYVKYNDKGDKFDPSEFASVLPKELFSSYSDMLLKDESDLDISLSQDSGKGEIELIKRELEIVNFKERLEEIAKKIKSLERSKGKKVEVKKLQRKFSSISKKLTKLQQEN